MIAIEISNNIVIVQTEGSSKEIAEFLAGIDLEFWKTFHPDVLDGFELSFSEDNFFFFQDLADSGFETFLANNIAMDTSSYLEGIVANIDLRDGFVIFYYSARYSRTPIDMIHYTMLDQLKEEVRNERTPWSFNF